MSETRQNGSNGKNGQRSTENSAFIIEEVMAIVAPSDGNNGKYDRNPFQLDSPEWNLGWTDGRFGQPASRGVEIVSTQTLRDLGSEETRLREELLSMRTKLGLLDDRITRTAPRLDAKRELLEIKENEKIESSHGSSRTWSYFYLFTAALLFLADIPLTVKLVATGFGMLPEGTPSNSLSSATISNMRAWTDFILDYWGVIFLALGLVALGVFVKVFIDKIALAEPGDVSKNRKVVITRAVLMVALFLTYLATLVFLGFYREDQLNIQENLQLARQVDKLAQARKDSGLPALTPLEIRKEKTDLEDEFQKSKSGKAPYVFILLTVLFPTVGGLCFSIGARELSRNRSYEEARASVQNLQTDIDSALEEQERLRLSIREKENRLEEIPDDEVARDRIIKQKVNCYLHGYDRGSKMMFTLEAGESLFNRCQSFVVTKVAEQARKRLWSTSGGGGE